MLRQPLPVAKVLRTTSPTKLPRSRGITSMVLITILVALCAALTPTRVDADANRINNYDFETGAMSGWVQWRPGTRAFAGIDCYNCANHTPGTWSPGTSNPLSNPSNHWNAFIQPEGEQVALYQNVTSSVVPGQEYHLRAWVTHNGMSAQLRWWSNVNGGTAGVCGTVPAHALYPIYVSISCYFTVPYGTTNLNVQLYSDGSGTYQGANKFVMTDDWSLTQPSHYDRAAAVTYADMWAKARNARYPNFSANDCTNFTSQVLEAGGYRQWVTDPTNSWAWFHTENPMYNHENSQTWSAANRMNEYATNWQYYSSDFQIRGTSMSAIYSLEAGDFFLVRLIDNDQDPPGPSHARVIVGYGSPQDGTTCPGGYSSCLLANQHSIDRFRVPAGWQIAETAIAWVWHVNW